MIQLITTKTILQLRLLVKKQKRILRIFIYCRDISKMQSLKNQNPISP